MWEKSAHSVLTAHLFLGCDSQKQIAGQRRLAQREKGIDQSHSRSSGVVAAESVEAPVADVGAERVESVARRRFYGVVMRVEQQCGARRVKICRQDVDIVAETQGRGAFFGQMVENQLRGAAFVA